MTHYGLLWDGLFSSLPWLPFCLPKQKFLVCLHFSQFELMEGTITTKNIIYFDINLFMHSPYHHFVFLWNILIDSDISLNKQITFFVRLFFILFFFFLVRWTLSGLDDDDLRFVSLGLCVTWLILKFHPITYSQIKSRQNSWKFNCSSFGKAPAKKLIMQKQIEA